MGEATGENREVFKVIQTSQQTDLAKQSTEMMIRE